MTQTEIDIAIAERARAGELLTEGELLDLDRADVLSLGMLADEVRRARVGIDVAYTRVLELKPSTPLSAAVTAGADEAGDVRIVELAESLPMTVSFVQAVRAVIGARTPLSGFSLGDIKERAWGPVAESLVALKHAGLDAVAEAPVDRVSVGDIEAALAAGLSVGTLSVQKLEGAGHVPLLITVRELCRRLPMLLSFSPLSREQAIATPTTGYHDVRLVALARIALPQVPEIRVDWQQYGPKLAQVALTFGANHLDRVSMQDDASLGRRRTSVEDVRRNIVAAGFTPVERSPGA